MNRFTALLATLLAFTAFSQKTVSKDAIFVVELDGDYLSSRMSPAQIAELELWDDLRKSINRENPSNVDLMDYGLDFKESMFISMVTSDTVDYVQFSIPLKKNKALVQELTKSRTPEKLGSFVAFNTGDAAMVFDKKNLVVVMPKLHYHYVRKYRGTEWEYDGYSYEEEVYDEEYDDEEITIEDLERQLKEVDTEEPEPTMPSRWQWKRTKGYELATRFAIDRLRGVEDISSHPEFRSFQNRKDYAAGAYMNYDKFWEMQRNQMARGYGDEFMDGWVKHIANTLAGLDVNAYLEFDKDEASFTTYSAMSPEMRRSFDVMTSKKLDASKLKYLPASTVGFMAFSMEMSKAYDEYVDLMLPKDGNEQVQLARDIYEVVDIALDQEEILGMVKGDMWLAYTDVKMVERKYTDYQWDSVNFEYHEVVERRTRPEPTFVLMAGVGNELNYHKIFKLMARVNDDDVSYDGTTMTIDDGLKIKFRILNGHLFVTNDMDYLESLTADGCGNNLYESHKQYIHDNAAMYFDFQKFMTGLPKEEFRSKELRAMESAMKTFDKVALTQAGWQGEEYVTKMDVDIKGEGSNSFQNLMNGINSLYKILD